MSKYYKQIDINDSICPYCGNFYQVESEDYSEDDHEITCENCGKRYYLSQEFTVTHFSTPDCELNGNKHEFEYMDVVSGLSGLPIYHCVICDKLTSMNYED